MRSLTERAIVAISVVGVLWLLTEPAWQQKPGPSVVKAKRVQV